ncbi:tetratricopeptide repeat protein [Geobacter pelophilus]|uniref:Tetratricopeptide repeat protein n=1 Tax=Geoanaerobacter pelophilus TaxID=60036 RepID=A0AAW4L5G3_9BACT|nr:tetratricopeptide repeat protein [Geoanaerobacter pelophilus]MBT0666241.1 tetratricopeptide repeat protein [Geoanaerobacter pelophilus]
MFQIFRKLAPTTFIPLLLVAATLLVYWQVIYHDFTNLDDLVYLVNNPYVSSGLNSFSIQWAFTTFHGANWHPLTWLSHMLDVQIYGMRAGGHHFTSVLLHVANTVILFFLLCRMTRKVWQSALVAALFALHPLHVESVAWASERKDVLSTFFWILSIWWYVCYVEQRRLLWYLLAVASMALGLMSKPMLVTLPCVLLLLDYWPLARSQSLGIRLLDKGPFAVLAVASCLVTIRAQTNAISSLEATSLGDRLINGVVSYTLYLWKTVNPWNLAVFYPFPEAFPFWQVLGSTGFIAVVTVWVVLQRHTRPYLMAGWLLYLGTLVPVIGIVQVGSQQMADRYSYIPLIGIFIMAVWMISGLSVAWVHRRRICTGLSLLVLAVCMTLTWRQVSFWSDSTTLFTHALAVTGDNYVAHYCLGLDLEKTGRCDEAISHYKKANALATWYSGPYLHQAICLERNGRNYEALALFNHAQGLEPNTIEVYLRKGLLLEKLGRLAEAIETYTTALAIDPHAADAHFYLAEALRKLKRLDDAEKHYLTALRINPLSAEYHNYFGTLLVEQGKLSEAANEYLSAISYDAHLTSAHHNLALLFQNTNRMDDAEMHYLRALEIDPLLFKTHNNLGVLYAQQGQRHKAVQHFEAALKIKPDYQEARENLNSTRK